MMYTFEYRDQDGKIITWPVPAPRGRALKYLRIRLKRYGIIYHFGDGFWTRSGVYLGRIIAQDAKKQYTNR